MRTALRVVLGFILVVLVVVVIAYADGTTLPVTHSISVEGTIAAPPARVYALISDVAHGAAWRHELKSVRMLPPDQGREHWIEDLGNGITMDFVAQRSDPPSAEGNAIRVVDLKDPSYGGSWTYNVTPASTANETHLRITEDGYIHPPLYRFAMVHVFGPTKNLDQYMNELRAAAPKS